MILPVQPAPPVAPATRERPRTLPRRGAAHVEAPPHQQPPISYEPPRDEGHGRLLGLHNYDMEGIAPLSWQADMVYRSVALDRP